MELLDIPLFLRLNNVFRLLKNKNDSLVLWDYTYE